MHPELWPGACPPKEPRRRPPEWNKVGGCACACRAAHSVHCRANHAARRLLRRSSCSPASEWREAAFSRKLQEWSAQTVSTYSQHCEQN